MAFSAGSLVKVRGREWVVLPDSQDEFLIVRPLGGTDAEVAGIDTALESVEEARFALPDPSRLGDYQGCRMLRDAIRLGFRSSAGPFRSFGRIAVEPRAYQLVPLLMALKLDPIRLLIADDVGIGKTIEALLIAKELLDRGEVNRLAILCPPHLAEQWKEELHEKFHIDAELVLASTANKLDRLCGNRSVFEVFPFTVVSMDYIKSESRREDFVRACPELVIVDEAHTCTLQGQAGRGTGRQQRHQVVQALAKTPGRHVLLVTATPHSGNEEGFRSLLALLKPEFGNLPLDLSGDQNRRQREELARHFVQRRRADIRKYLEFDTAFPDRLEQEQTYQLGKDSDYQRLFERVLSYAREVVKDAQALAKVRQRVCWWAALGMLRALASSPAAAAATLRSKIRSISAQSPEEVDQVSRPLVFDEDLDETAEAPDVIPGADVSDPESDTSTVSRERKKLLELAREAEELQGDKDPKLVKVVQIVKSLVGEGHRPILFCRFIATAEYLGEQLRKRLPKDVTVMTVTGTIPPSEREERILTLRDLKKYVMVCTDCLSEGVNLQHLFDAVIHYDLSWNPTRHEQREGRVDRFGQPKPVVKVVTYYGTDNQIDGVVLEVLLRKHQTIRKALGISIPVPSSSNALLEALYEGLLLRKKENKDQPGLFDMLPDEQSKVEEFEAEWQNAAEREKRSRSLFAQQTIKPDEVALEVAAMRQAIGSEADVQRFVTTAVKAYRGTLDERHGRFRINLKESPLAVREAIGERDEFNARFQPNPQDDELYLARTSAVVEGLASYVMNTALDSNQTAEARPVAARCGVIRTKKVTGRTTLLLVRFRYHILTTVGGETKPVLAEDCRLLGFRGAPASADWLLATDAEALLEAIPDDNVPDDVARNFVQKAIDDFDRVRPRLDQLARERGKELLAAHQRVRHAARRTGVKYDIEPQLPPDVLGLYVYLPVL